MDDSEQHSWRWRAFPSFSKTLLRNCPPQVTLLMKAQAGGAPIAPRSNFTTMALGTLRRGSTSEELVSYSSSTPGLAGVGRERERLKYVRNPAAPGAGAYALIEGVPWSDMMENVNPLFPQASHDMVISLLQGQFKRFAKVT